MYYAENINLIRFDVVDDSVRAFYHFSDLVCIVFWNTTAGEGEVGDLLRPSCQPIDHTLGIFG